MRTFLTILILLLLVACNLSTHKVIEKYPNGQTKTEYVYPDRHDTSSYVCNGYYENGKLKFITEVVSGMFVGDKISYFENGIVKRKEKLSRPTLLDDTLYDCHITIYRPDGTKESDYTYENDEINGLATDYDSSGNIARTTEYIGGKVNGLSIIYYPNGKIKTLAHCRNDSAYGYEYNFDENGDTLNANIHYGQSDHGVFAKKWLSNGRLLTGSYGDSDRNFVIWKLYDKKRSLLRTIIDKGTRIDSVTTRFITPLE